MPTNRTRVFVNLDDELLAAIDADTKAYGGDYRATTITRALTEFRRLQRAERRRVPLTLQQARAAVDHLAREGYRLPLSMLNLEVTAANPAAAALRDRLTAAGPSADDAIRSALIRAGLTCDGDTRGRAEFESAGLSILDDDIADGADDTPDLPVTRVTVVLPDGQGAAEFWADQWDAHRQDGGRTLKLFGHGASDTTRAEHAHGLAEDLGAHRPDK